MFNMKTYINEQQAKMVTKKKIQHYTYGIEDILGKGFSSHVYKGKDDNTGEPVAVKVIQMDMVKKDVYKDLLASEIYCLKLLRNVPHVIQLKDVYSTKNNTYVICQLCQSGTLSNLLAKKRLSQHQALRYMEQLIKGYTHLHQLGIIHRDIKPANIFVQKDKLKIADFGFATFCSQKKIQQKFNIGSPLYMPPESLMKNQYSFKTDIWSLGIVFYEMLFGKAPWRANTQSQLLNKILQTPIVHLIPKNNLSSISIQLLTRILDPDCKTRMSPEELNQFSFNRSKNMYHSQGWKTKNSKEQDGLVSTNGTVNSSSGSDVLSLTKQLLSQMHMCRFISKLIKRILQSNIHHVQSQGLISCLKQFLGTKLSQISQLQYINTLNIPLLSEYRKTEDYSKLIKLSKTYRTKYQNELGYLQDNVPISHVCSNVLVQISQLIRHLSSVFPRITYQNIKQYEPNILLLDYLTTAYMLMKLMSNNDIVLFYQKSKIQDIVDGQTSSVGYDHFIALQNKINALRLV